MLLTCEAVLLPGVGSCIISRQLQAAQRLDLSASGPDAYQVASRQAKGDGQTRLWADTRTLASQRRETENARIPCMPGVGIS